ncbi:MAG: carbohydrate ABC transporter permease [Actinobacteria bacterium]|nr:carbohydrate ABC transporter permease [Actinomycetota bacterium]
MVFPFLWMIISSFKPNLEIISVGFKLFSENWTLDNYIRVIQTLSLNRAYFNSTVIAVVVTVSVIFTSSAAGFMFAKLRFWGRDLLFFIVLGSVMIPSQIVLIPLYIMISKLHLVNTYFGVMFPFLMSAFGVFLMRQFIYGIPTEIIEAARIDGASDFKIYYKVILPLTKPALSVVAILTFLWSWDELLWPLVVINSNEMKTLPIIFGYFSMAEGGAIAGPSMAAATIVITPVLIVYAFFQRFFVKGLSMTGLKEG